MSGIDVCVCMCEHSGELMKLINIQEIVVSISQGPEIRNRQCSSSELGIRDPQ